ncbi:hypothetical protein GC176_18355 [bacterium]|nr:hypothetical protein [bacterium]
MKSKTLTGYFIVSMLCCIVWLAGCERREHSSMAPVIQRESCDYVLMLAVDVETIRSNPRAFEFIQQAVETYFQERIGGNDQIIITQLSGNDRPLLWQGTPQHLLEEFEDAESFKNYLIGASSPGRRINQGLADSLNYVLDTFSVKKGKAKTVTLIVSSMLDDQPQGSDSDAQLMDSLIEYGHRGGLAFYFCDQSRMDYVRDKMEEAGFGWTILECDIYGRPPLPEFE